MSITASGDAIDSNGSLEITGGTITCEGPIQGDTSVLDFDTIGTITGGTFMGTEAAKMIQTLSSTTQGVLTVSTGFQQAGSELTAKDSSGNEVCRLSPEQPFGLLIMSSSDIQPGVTYEVEVGGQTLTAQAS